MLHRPMGQVPLLCQCKSQSLVLSSEHTLIYCSHLPHPLLSESPKKVHWADPIALDSRSLVLVGAIVSSKELYGQLLLGLCLMDTVPQGGPCFLCYSPVRWAWGLM